MGVCVRCAVCCAVAVQSNPSPTILLFSSASNATLLAYDTPGSMFAVDVFADARTVWVVADGKHVNANVMGNGGDLFVFSVPRP